MHIQISLTDGVPLYRQIVNQVKYMVASGQLVPHEELPPIRALAEQLQITPNTVVKAYGELEADGTVYKRRGAGTYVAETASPLARKEQRRILSERADALLSEARQFNFGFDEVLRLLEARQAVLQKKSDESQAAQKAAQHKTTSQESTHAGSRG